MKPDPTPAGETRPRARFGAALSVVMFAAVFTVVMLAAGQRARAGDGLPCGLEPAGRGTVAAIVDGETLRLSDGREVRLIGAAAPRPPLDAPPGAPYPPASAAAQALKHLAQAHQVLIARGGAPTDRHGRLLAHLFVVDADKGDGDTGAAPGLWLQRAMIAGGHARAYSLEDNRACMAALKAVEAGARRQKTGLWGSGVFSVWPASATAGLAAHVHGFALVEGRVVKTAAVGRRIYLNFGDDYRRDFTISVARRRGDEFRKAGIDLTALQGRTVRVRGWLSLINGPLIEATHAEQLEILGGAGE